MTKRHICSLCDKSFGRKYDLKRHENTIHAEDENSNEKSDENEDSEVDVALSQKVDSDSVYSETDKEYDESEDEDSESDIKEDDFGDSDVYQEWFQQAFEETQEIRNEKYQKYIHQGMSEEQAKEKAYMKTLWVFQRVFFDKYISFLWSDVYLKEDEIHNEIVDDLEYKMEGGMDINKALKRVVCKTIDTNLMIFFYMIKTR